MGSDVRRHRVTESEVSIALGAVLLAFFLDGFVRDSAPAMAVALVAVGVLIAIGLYRINDPSPIAAIRVRDIALVLAGTLLVGACVRVLGMPSELAAALVGLLAGALPFLTTRISAGTAGALYVGAFAGMTSPVVLLGPQWLIVSGLLTGIWWSIARDAWAGIGGRMGTVAFAGVAMTSLLAWAFGMHAEPLHRPAYAWHEMLAIIVACIASAVLTHALAYRWKLGPVLGSAAPVAAVVVLTWPLRSTLGVHVVPVEALSAAWLGASFVGMTAPARLNGRRWMLPLMALAFAYLLLAFQARLAGMGGDLGATAATAVIAVIGAASLLAPRR